MRLTNRLEAEAAALRTAVLGSLAAMIAVGCFGVAVWSTMGASGAGAAEHSFYGSSKAAFCSANVAIDRASANVTSATTFLAALQAHKQDLTTMLKNAPPGPVGKLAKQLVNGAETALATHNPNVLATLHGGPVDTYCGVDGSGNPLPPYFDKGKQSAFCSNFLPIYLGVGNSTSDAQILSAFTTHQAQLAQLGADASKVPDSLKTAATTMVNTSKEIISSKNLSLVQGLASPVGKLALYCGQNQ